MSAPFLIYHWANVRIEKSGKEYRHCDCMSHFECDSFESNKIVYMGAAAFFAIQSAIWCLEKLINMYTLVRALVAFALCKYNPMK